MGRKRKTKKKRNLQRKKLMARKKRETRTRKRRKRLKKKASKLKSSPKMSLQDTTFFSTSTTTTHPKHNKQDRKKNGVLHTQSTRHRLFIKKRLARRQLSLKNPVPPYIKSSPDVHLPAHPLNSHSSSLE